VIAERTRHVAGLARSRGGSGDPSPFTALGVEAAILASCERVFAQRSLRDLRICVVGLGHVGSRVAKRCARAGASLVLADVDERKRSLAEQLQARWVSPDEALVSDVDVLVPCALGGIFDDETVPTLRCRVVAGAANNQLADDRIAALLQAHGVLWAPDFVANAGGIINIAEEVGTYDPANARRRVKSIGDTLRTIYDRADAEHTTPLAAALSLASLRLATRNGRPPRPRATGAV
jgi:leucine dehydrogenase